MSEFKFACPVCGQHISADSRASGTQLECPTCFQSLIVPQGPAAGSKLILSAAQVAKPRPVATQTLSEAELRPARARANWMPALALGVVVLCAGTAAWFYLRMPRTGSAPGPAADPTNASPSAATLVQSAYPVPTNFGWSLDVTQAVFPEGMAAGSLQGHGFFCERATLQGGTLTLRQGKGWPPDLAISIGLVARQGEELSGKTIFVRPAQVPPLPKLTLRWKDEQQQPANRNFTSGYALKILFGQAANGRMPGKIYLCLPDEAKSFVAGTFDAEIRKPTPPKPRPPARR